MTVQSGFFSDGSSYNQADFNAFLLDSIGSGYVLGYENELEVTPNTPANMGVVVQTGRCYVQGYYGWVTDNEALTVPTAHNTLPRIDRVVARLSVSVNQSVTFAIKTGTPAANPSAPALTRTSETYEISLARIAVGAGVASIVAGDITDERGDATVCGVAGVKHSWQYLSNVAIDVSEMSVDAGVSDRDPVYFDGTNWVVATNGAVGFYDKANATVITSGYLDGFTGLTPGAIVGNRGVALTATEIVVLESPVDSSGVKHVGDIIGNLTGSGCIKRKITYSSSPDGVLFLAAGQDTSLDHMIFTTPIFHSLVLPTEATNAGNIVIYSIGVFDGNLPPYGGHVDGSCTITCYDASGSVVYTHTLIGTQSINQTSSSWDTYTASIPQNTARITITGSLHWRWDAVYVTLSNP